MRIKWDKESMNKYASEYGYKVLETKLVEKTYQKQQWALIECPEGHEPYWQWWNNFKTGYRCKKCAGYEEWNTDKVNLFIKEFGFELITDFTNVDTCFYMKDKNGYLAYTNLSTIKAAIKRRKNSRVNNFNISKGYSLFSKEVAITNLKHHCKNYRQDYELCSVEWKGIKAKYCFKYIGPIELKNRYFETTADAFYYGCQGHPDLNMSKGAMKIYNYLYNNNFDFKTEYTFKNLKRINRLKYDFAIIENEKVKALIEFHGIQHFDKENYFYDELVVENDLIKKQYAEKNKIPFLEIRYDEVQEIENILLNFIQRLEKAHNKCNS